MENKLQLSPPEYLLFEQIKSSIGTDATLCIKPIYEKEGIYYIDIITDFKCTATGLATIMIPEYDFGGIKVKVRIFWRCECHHQVKPIKHPRGNKVNEGKKLIELALRCNPYYLATIKKPKDAPPSTGSLIIIFRKKVIQYYSDDISDFFQYSNFVAQDVFKAILENKIFCSDVSISFSTEIIEDQRVYIYDCESYDDECKEDNEYDDENDNIE